MATIQVEEHMRSTWEVTWWWKWKVFLRKPQGKEELEPPEAAKEKQVSTLKCEFGPDNTSVWVFMLRNDESLIYVILNDHVCCDSLTKKKKIQQLSLSSSQHRIFYCLLMYWQLSDLSWIRRTNEWQTQDSRHSRYIVFVDIHFHLIYELNVWLPRYRVS